MKIKGVIVEANATGSGLSSVRINVDGAPGQQVILSLPKELMRTVGVFPDDKVELTLEVAAT